MVRRALDVSGHAEGRPSCTGKRERKLGMTCRARKRAHELAKPCVETSLRAGLKARHFPSNVTVRID